MDTVSWYNAHVDYETTPGLAHHLAIFIDKECIDSVLSYSVYAPPSTANVPVIKFVDADFTTDDPDNDPDDAYRASTRLRSRR